VERQVGCELTFRVRPGTVLALQIQPAAAGPETMSISGGTTVREVLMPQGGRIGVVHAEADQLVVRYAGTVRPRPPAEADPGWDAEAIGYLLQSRYCPSDALAGFARAELDGSTPTEVADWVHRRLTYTLGLSTPLTTAIETLGAGAGACRDFAHLTITLLRAIGIPARMVAVYAPGLSPMDFHAVAEAKVDGRWQVLDSTRLAPRQSLVRIATGRDATDTAFATTLQGDAELLAMEVTAVVDGALPVDDHRGVVELA
jgi:transglutaminase-like putative cysteine protease